VTELSHAVFLSYASQDADAARRICEALRAAGIEVWFDQSELRGGEAWDRRIRKQIHDCALFIPVISANAHARIEGYFRLEWKLAVDRSHRIAPDQTFLLPVVIDDTPQTDERIPDPFRDVQWSRLPGGAASPAFVTRLLGLLSPGHAGTTTPRNAPGLSLTPPRATSSPQPALTPKWSKSALRVAGGVLVAAALAYLIVDKLWILKRQPASHPPAAAAEQAAPRAGSTPASSEAAFSPPAHSVAVLPFVNLSGDKEQEYFSDGLTEEVLNSLAQIEGLQVAARTSSFSFKEHPDVATVAHKLNVAAVLEGSVRRSARTVRVTAQLINAVTGFHLWSKTYDRDLGDVLKLQSEIATAVANALKVTLLGDVGEKIELGGTRNPAAFDAYLRGSKLYREANDAQGAHAANAAYTEAIRLDPRYARAFAGRAIALCGFAPQYETVPVIRVALEKAVADAHQALALAPELAYGRLALARCFEARLDFAQATAEYERALALAPGDSDALQLFGRFAAQMGRTEQGVAMARRALALDPLNPLSHDRLGQALIAGRRYDEALAIFQEYESLETDHALRGIVYLALGNLEGARSSCQFKPDYWFSQVCLAITYDKLGRHADAEATLAKLMAGYGEVAAFEYAQIYAQWGDSSKALEWLETALRLRDSGLRELKTDPLLDPLRQEPRFKAIERELKFPP
jgi:TolB-like protein